MGKSKRNKARKQHAAEAPPQYMVLEMAPAEPVPDPFFRPDPPSSPGLVGTALSPYTRRELSYSVNAWQFLLTYLSYVKDGGFEVPAADFAPRRPDETEDQARMRILKAQKMREVQWAAGSWRDQAAEVLAWTPRNDAPQVREHIFRVSAGWLDAVEFTVERDAWIAGTRPLLGAMCPPQHWMAALEILEWQAEWGMRPTHPTDLSDANCSLALAEHTQPSATIHVAAASVAWLYGLPEVVTDRIAAFRKIAEDARSFAHMV